MFSVLKGLIYLLCHEKIKAINTSILLCGEGEFPRAHPREWPFSFDFLTLPRLGFSYDFSVIQTLSGASDDFRAGRGGPLLPFPILAPLSFHAFPFFFPPVTPFSLISTQRLRSAKGSVKRGRGKLIIADSRGGGRGLVASLIPLST